MNSKVKSAAEKAVVKAGLMGVYRFLSLTWRGPLREDGWFTSCRLQTSVDRASTPLPWFTYPFLEFLTGRVRPELSVFEYGAGSSTLWWAKKVARVVACEHDASWYEKISKQIPPNAQIFQIDLVRGGAYSEKILEYPGQFNIIVIDGRDRERCAVNSLEALTPDGVIIWDNSDRDCYKKGMQELRDKGFRQLSFVGLAPICAWKCETSVFYRDGNCLGI